MTWFNNSPGAGNPGVFHQEVFDGLDLFIGQRSPRGSDLLLRLVCFLRQARSASALRVAVELAQAIISSFLIPLNYAWVDDRRGAAALVERGPR